MYVEYCDLCGVPLKENENFILYITDDTKERKITTYEEYNNYLKEIEKNIKRICPTCKKIIDSIFELRMQNINKLSDELLGYWDLPEKEKENGKK